MDALKVYNRHPNTARNIIPNYLTFNKDNGTQIFSVVSGSGTASVSDDQFTCGDRSLFVGTSSTVEVNSATFTRTKAYKTGRYFLCFSVYLVDSLATTPYLNIKLAKNNIPSWLLVEAKDMQAGVWTDFFIDFNLSDKDYLDFSFATNSEFYIDEIGVYCDDRGMMLPPMYSEPYKSIPSATGLADGVYNLTADSGINTFTEVPE